MKISIRRYRKLGTHPPRGYGLAYFDHISCVGVFYPVPLNWVFWLAREVWYRMRIPPQGAFDAALLDAYKRGHDDTKNMHDMAEKMGYELGKEKGRAEYRAELEKKLADETAARKAKMRSIPEERFY